MRDTKSLLLILLCFCLIGTWFYHLYDKSNYTKPVKESVVRDSIIHQVDTVFLNRPDTASHVDSGKTAAAPTIALPVTSTGTPASPAQNLSLTIPTSVTKETAVKPSAPSALKTSQLSFKAASAQDKQVTNQAAKADQLDISFQVQSKTASYDHVDIYLVLTDPKGNVIQDDVWQGGIFTTNTGAAIKYTRKFTFDYQQGEPKKIAVPVEVSRVIAGDYKLQLYHNNTRIGNADLVLK